MLPYLSKLIGVRSSSSKNATNVSQRVPKVPDIESMDPHTHQATNQAPNTQAAGDERSSSGTFVRITSSLVYVNQQVAEFIMSSGEDVRKDKHFLSLVNSYIESSSKTLDLCVSMESCIDRAKVSMLNIWYAVKLFEREAEMESHECLETNKCLRLLEDLREFKAAGGDPFKEEFLVLFRFAYEENGRNKYRCVLEETRKSTKTSEPPFDEEFFILFASVYQQQEQLLQKLLYQKRDLDKKLKEIRRWKRVSNIVFAIGFFSVPVLTAVVLAVSVPSSIEVLIGAFSATIGSIGKWCSYSWNKREKAAEEQKGRIASINISTFLMLRDMDNIRALVQKVEFEIENLMQMAEFTLIVESDAVKIVIDELGKKLNISLRSVEDAGQHTSRCSNNVNKTRSIVSKKIQDHSSESKRGNWLEIFM